jgi:hypothetical protein
MDFLAEQKYQVIALRDLARYQDPTAVPKDPWAIIQIRQAWTWPSF